MIRIREVFYVLYTLPSSHFLIGKRGNVVLKNLPVKNQRLPFDLLADDAASSDVLANHLVAVVVSVLSNKRNREKLLVAALMPRTNRVLNTRAGSANSDADVTIVAIEKIDINKSVIEKTIDASDETIRIGLILEEKVEKRANAEKIKRTHENLLRAFIAQKKVTFSVTNHEDVYDFPFLFPF